MTFELDSISHSQEGRFKLDCFNDRDGQLDKIDQDQQKPTSQFDVVYQQQQNFNYLSRKIQLNIEKHNLKQPQKNLQLEQKSNRPKNFIKTGQKFRYNYMMAKKGSNQETNDLSINVCTIIKSFCKDYKTIDRIENNEEQLINQFAKGKQNLSTIRKLFGFQQFNTQQGSQRKQSQQQIQPQRNGGNLREYLSKQFQETQTVKNFLTSKKMKFNNKITLLKYLQVVRKNTMGSDGFQGWKNNKL